MGILLINAVQKYYRILIQPLFVTIIHADLYSFECLMFRGFTVTQCIN